MFTVEGSFTPDAYPSPQIKLIIDYQYSAILAEPGFFFYIYRNGGWALCIFLNSQAVHFIKLYKILQARI